MVRVIRKCNRCFDYKPNKACTHCVECGGEIREVAFKVFDYEVDECRECKELSVINVAGRLCRNCKG